MRGSDPDGDALAWLLDADGDGEADGWQDAPATFPATVEFTYEAGGLYNVSLWIDDGTEPVRVGLLLNASAPGQQASATYSLGQGFCGAVYPPNGAGVVYGVIDIDPATHGLAFRAEWKYGVHDGMGAQLVFRDATNGVLEIHSENAQGLLVVGIVPAGAAFVQASDCGGVGGATVSYFAGAA